MSRRRQAFAQSDRLAFDHEGVLWIQADSSAKNMAQPDWKNIGNNQMLAADPAPGDIRRFLTGPKGSEITGIARTRYRAVSLIGKLSQLYPEIPSSFTRSDCSDADDRRSKSS
jgi:hypothetical protein